MSPQTLVLGAAVSGVAAARLARRLGHDVLIYDRNPEAVAVLGVDLDVATASGEWRPDLLEGRDLVVTSPGIPPHATPLAAALAAPVELISEMEFAYRHLDVPCAAITGTNGKTTATAAAAIMLGADGREATAAGNIGFALSDVVGSAAEVVVVEASSFQLEFVDTFHPAAAAILNVAPDHLDWHGTTAAYAAAKRRIGARQTAEDIIVYDADDPGAVAAVAGLPARPVPVSGRHCPPGGNGPDSGGLHIDDVTVPRPDLDAAYTMDLTAAATVARHMGASAEAIAKGIASFSPEAHRRSVVGQWDGVTWVNDSKATNPHAAVAAVQAYDSVVLIAGGRNKGLDLGPLVAQGGIRAVVALGEAAGELAAATPGDQFHEAESLAAAVALADGLAVPGDTVLLAPGCASFDMFRDYQERGRTFTELVLKRKEG